jgi:hypothetical protein
MGDCWRTSVAERMLIHSWALINGCFTVPTGPLETPTPALAALPIFFFETEHNIYTYILTQQFTACTSETSAASPRITWCNTRIYSTNIINHLESRKSARDTTVMLMESSSLKLCMALL